MRFFALELALQLVRSLPHPVRKTRIHDRRLADQVTSARSSIALNLGEGNRRAGKDRKHLFRVASGSAEEVRTALRVTVAWGHLQAPALEAVLDDIARLQRILWKLTR